MARTYPLGFRPNIWNIRLDDGSVDYASVGLRNTLKVLYGGGWRRFVKRSNCTISLCFPGRASGWTGVFPHVHEITDNDSNETEIFDWDATYFVGLRQAGYYNGAVGKWGNGYGETGNGGWGVTRKSLFPGMDFMRVIFGNPTYHDFDYMNGTTTLLQYRGVNDANYMINVEKDSVMEFFNSTLTRPNQPWSLYWATKASHVDPTPPDEYATTDIPFTDNPAFGLDPRNPEFNCPGWMIDDFDPNFDADDQRATHLIKHQIHYCLDDGIKEGMDWLIANNQLDKTIIIVSTDNSANTGEHMQRSAKGSLLKSANDIVLYVRMPEPFGSPNIDIDHSATSDMDICTTILHAAGAHTKWAQNGMSLLNLLQNRDANHRLFAPYLNLWKDSPTGIGLIKKDGTVYGQGLPGGDAEGQFYSWAGTDPYCVYNLGDNAEMRYATKLLKDRVSYYE